MGFMVRIEGELKGVQFLIEADEKEGTLLAATILRRLEMSELVDVIERVIIREKKA